MAKRKIARKSSKKSLLLFSMPHCSPCKKLKTALKAARIPVKVINCTGRHALADKLKIFSVPVLAVKNGKKYRKIGTSVAAAKRALGY